MKAPLDVEKPYRCEVCGRAVWLTVREPLPADWTVRLCGRHRKANAGNDACVYRCGGCGR